MSERVRRPLVWDSHRIRYLTIFRLTADTRHKTWLHIAKASVVSILCSVDVRWFLSRNDTTSMCANFQWEKSIPLHFSIFCRLFRVILTFRVISTISIRFRCSMMIASIWVVPPPATSSSSSSTSIFVCSFFDIDCESCHRIKRHLLLYYRWMRIVNGPIAAVVSLIITIHRFGQVVTDTVSRALDASVATFSTLIIDICSLSAKFHIRQFVRLAKNSKGKQMAIKTRHVWARFRWSETTTNDNVFVRSSCATIESKNRVDDLFRT